MLVRLADQSVPAAHGRVPLDFYTMNEDEEPDWPAVQRDIGLLA
jgi:hypothetical protein